jgi:hypothetical protein
MIGMAEGPAGTESFIRVDLTMSVVPFSENLTLSPEAGP